MPRDADRFEIPAEPPGRRERGTWLARQAVRALHSDAAEYDEVMEVVRGNLDEVHETARRWLASDTDPMLRWSVLHVLADAGDARSVELLHREALREVRVPMEAGTCEHPAEMEELVVIMAIEGLGTLAGRGERAAVDALFDVLRRQDRRSLRRPAAAALLEVDREHRERVAELLPEADRRFLDVRVAALDDMMLPPPDQERSERPATRETTLKPRWSRGRERPIVREPEERIR